MTIFLVLAGRHPAARRLVRQVRASSGSLASAGTTSGYVLAVLVGVNSVIAFFYYARVAALHVDGGRARRRHAPRSGCRPRCTIALVLTVGVTLVYGVFPGLVVATSPTRSASSASAADRRSSSLGPVEPVRSDVPGHDRHQFDRSTRCGRGDADRPRGGRPDPSARAAPFDEVIELALYDPVDGFFGGGRARAGGRDFLTSPEVGPLFGAVIARALDAWWDELGRPDPFTVVEAAAGAGTLARAVLAAAPDVRSAR